MVGALEAVFTTWAHLSLLLATTGHSRGPADGFAERFRSLLPVPVGSLLALDAQQRPWQSREASRADRRFALGTITKAAIAGPFQCGFYLTQQVGLTVHVSHRQL